MRTPAEATRADWVALAGRLAGPVLDAAGEGRLREALRPEHRADCGEDRLASSHLEAVGRTLLGLGPWLGLAARGGIADPGEAALAARLAAAARRGIAHGCTPGHADWFGLDRGTQPIVDVAFLACAFLHGREALWEPLGAEDRARVVAAFASLRDRKPWFSNWLLFPAAAETFLRSVGAPWDPMRVDYALRQHEQWYVGDGHYRDGPEFHADWYNSFVILPLLDAVLAGVADHDPQWAAFVPKVRARLARHAEVQERCVAPDGSFPAIGRSIAYRAGAFHALAHAALRGLLPPGLPPARARCALWATLRRTLASPANWRDDGFLRIGLNGHQPSLGETYITTGSLSLVCAALLPLGLPASDPFWSGPAEPWTSVRAFDLGEDLPADRALHG